MKSNAKKNINGMFDFKSEFKTNNFQDKSNSNENHSFHS